MANQKDYLPYSDKDLSYWVTNFYTKIEVKAQAWAIPTAEVEAVGSAFSQFANFLAEAESPDRTPVIVAKKNAARKTLTGLIRTMVRFRLNNPILTDADRIDLGLHVRDTTYTPVPVPETRPELDIKVLDVRRLKVAFRDQENEEKGRPYGVNGAVIVYAVLDEPPADVTALGRSVLATRTPHTLEFAEGDRGKTVYLAICWQNNKGERGPWSEIESAIVP
ncbi:MAG: hypothetical protein LBS05_02865 [Tannerellaceae bacterium]|jgi:hypothetical protein|nr:hypothetical protein [Tannerellaceae bacterium]